MRTISAFNSRSTGFFFFKKNISSWKCYNNDFTTRAGVPHRSPRTPVCAPLEAAAEESLLWYGGSTRWRVAPRVRPIVSVCVFSAHTHTLTRTQARTHTGAQHSHGDMRPADAATVSGASFLNGAFMSPEGRTTFCDRVVVYVVVVLWRKGKFGFSTFSFSILLSDHRLSPIGLRNAACDRSEKKVKTYRCCRLH